MAVSKLSFSKPTSGAKIQGFFGGKQQESHTQEEFDARSFRESFDEGDCFRRIFDDSTPFDGKSFVKKDDSFMFEFRSLASNVSAFLKRRQFAVFFGFVVIFLVGFAFAARAESRPGGTLRAELRAAILPADLPGHSREGTR